MSLLLDRVIPELQTPCDYFLWGYMKRRIFHRNDPPRTLMELRAAIEDVAEELRQNREMCLRVMANYEHRFRVCLERDVGQVEIR